MNPNLNFIRAAISTTIELCFAWSFRKSGKTGIVFWCSSEDDLDVPDADIEIDAERLMQALAVSAAHTGVLNSVSIPINICSEGYSGKIRQDKLEIRHCPYTGRFWTDAWFVNDWSGSRYSFDTDRHWPVPKEELQGYLKNLLETCRRI